MSTEPAALGRWSRNGEDDRPSTAAGPPDRDSGPAWRKSEYSDGTAECVEVARRPGGRVLLRDSRHPAQPAIEVSAQAWHTFVHAVRSGELD